MTPLLLTAYCEALLGLPVSHAWRGYGSAAFLEFGALTKRTRRNGSAGNPRGIMGLMLGCTWRIEGQDAVLCGGDSNINSIDEALRQMVGVTVANLATSGRLPEIALDFSNQKTISTFKAGEGDPEWAIFDRRVQPMRWLAVESDQLIEDSKSDFRLRHPWQPEPEVS